MNRRDFDYIETRLAAPVVEVSEAQGRLKQAGYTEEAEELMTAMQAFVDSCRIVRRKVTDRANREHYGRTGYGR